MIILRWGAVHTRRKIGVTSRILLWFYFSILMLARQMCLVCKNSLSYTLRICAPIYIVYFTKKDFEQYFLKFQEMVLHYFLGSKRLPALIWDMSALINKTNQIPLAPGQTYKNPYIQISSRKVVASASSCYSNYRTPILEEGLFIFLPPQVPKIPLQTWESHFMHVSPSSGVKENTFTIKNLKFASHSLTFLISKTGSRLHGFVGKICFIKMQRGPDLAIC